jgi:hypothetical protein
MKPNSEHRSRLRRLHIHHAVLIIVGKQNLRGSEIIKMI